MQPGRAAINANEQFQVGNSAINPAAFGAVALPPPNPALGDGMRNRQWQQREQLSYYQMASAPLPWQYTNNAPHPIYGGGSGDPRTQYMVPAQPPTGFAARQSPVTYGNPGVSWVRPTYAYNRVAGAPRPAPTNYAWPNQYYPGGSNTFIPSWEATGLIVKYTRSPSFFRINRYVKELKVPRSNGYYLTLGGDDPYRVQSVNDYLWDDSADAPGGRQERQAFGFQNYITARYCFPFSLGRKSVVQAEWPILAEHAAMAAAKAMTVRTLLNTTLATTTSNWTGSWGNNYAAASHQWTTSGTTAVNPTPYLQNDLNTALIQIEQASGGIVTDEEALQFTFNPQEARGFSTSDEYRSYIKGSPDALAAITDQRNPNRKYGLAPFLYGLRLVVENAIVVTTPKPANVPSPAATSRSYVWAQQYAVISSKPQGITASDEQTLDFSTFAFRFYEQMSTEQKSELITGEKWVEWSKNYVVSLQAPQTGFLSPDVRNVDFPVATSD